MKNGALLIVLGFFLVLYGCVGISEQSENSSSQLDNKLLYNNTPEINPNRGGIHATNVSTSNMSNDVINATKNESLQLCSDGTEDNTCSRDKPKFCNKGKLVDDPRRCGCPDNKIIVNGECTDPLTFDTQVLEQQLLDRINEYRKKYDLPSLSRSQTIMSLTEEEKKTYEKWQVCTSDTILFEIIDSKENEELVEKLRVFSDHDKNETVRKTWEEILNVLNYSLMSKNINVIEISTRINESGIVSISLLLCNEQCGIQAKLTCEGKCNEGFVKEISINKDTRCYAVEPLYLVEPFLKEDVHQIIDINRLQLTYVVGFTPWELRKSGKIDFVGLSYWFSPYYHKTSFDVQYSPFVGDGQFNYYSKIDKSSLNLAKNRRITDDYFVIVMNITFKDSKLLNKTGEKIAQEFIELNQIRANIRNSIIHGMVPECSYPTYHATLCEYGSDVGGYTTLDFKKIYGKIYSLMHAKNNSVLIIETNDYTLVSAFVQEIQKGTV